MRAWRERDRGLSERQESVISSLVSHWKDLACYSVSLSTCSHLWIAYTWGCGQNVFLRCSLNKGNTNVVECPHQVIVSSNDRNAFIFPSQSNWSSQQYSRAPIALTLGPVINADLIGLSNGSPCRAVGVPLRTTTCWLVCTTEPACGWSQSKAGPVHPRGPELLWMCLLTGSSHSDWLLILPMNKA